MLAFCAGLLLRAQTTLDQRISKETDSLTEIYKHIHQNPELSTKEKETSALLAGELRRLGFEVTERVGQVRCTGQCFLRRCWRLAQRPGPTVMVRTGLDALPVEERTGLPYASHVKAKLPDGEVGVMHACGHDLHMTHGSVRRACCRS